MPTIASSIAPKLLELETSNLVRSFVWEMECRAVAQTIFPESGRGLGHVTPTIFGIRSNISPKLFELHTSNLVHGFVGLCEAVRSAILATTWFLVHRSRIEAES